MAEVRLEPMTKDQYKPWRAEAEAHYAQSVAASGQSAEAAARNAADTYAQLLPEELATPDHHFWYAYDGERRVGFLWVKVTRETAFVYNVAVEEDVRRRDRPQHGQRSLTAPQPRSRLLDGPQRC